MRDNVRTFLSIMEYHLKKLEKENENETMKQCENCEIRTFCERVFYDLYNETGE